MRIAVSGTHCSGKTTLIEAFCRAHAEFMHEPEPYVVLQELYGEDFPEEPAVDDFYRQLEFNREALGRYKSGDRVIFERSPVDFLAYMHVLDDRNKGRDRAPLARQSFEMVREAVRLLDAIVFLPLSSADGIAAPDGEDLELRSAVDDYLNEVFLADELDLFASGLPLIFVARGTLAQRLVTLEEAMSA